MPFQAKMDWFILKYFKMELSIEKLVVHWFKCLWSVYFSGLHFKSSYQVDFVGLL